MHPRCGRRWLRRRGPERSLLFLLVLPSEDALEKSFLLLLAAYGVYVHFIVQCRLDGTDEGIAQQVDDSVPSTHLRIRELPLELDLGGHLVLLRIGEHVPNCANDPFP